MHTFHPSLLDAYISAITPSTEYIQITTDYIQGSPRWFIREEVMQLVSLLVALHILSEIRRKSFRMWSGASLPNKNAVSLQKQHFGRTDNPMRQLKNTVVGESYIWWYGKALSQAWKQQFYNSKRIIEVKMVQRGTLGAGLPQKHCHIPASQIWTV